MDQFHDINDAEFWDDSGILADFRIWDIQPDNTGAWETKGGYGTGLYGYDEVSDG